jgi:hypothetical protein
MELIFDKIGSSGMKILPILAVVLALVFTASANPITIADISPHLSTNAQIIWKAPVNGLPKSLWVYKILPNTFSVSQISNAMALASFQNKGIPQPSTNEIILWDHTREGDDPLAGWFVILPDLGLIEYSIRNHARGSSDAIPDDKTIAKRAWNCITQLGIDRTQLSQGGIQNNGCEYDGKGRLATNGYVGGRMIAFVRKIDGVDFPENSEGFNIELGSHGVIRAFNLNWPNLERFDNRQIVSAEQIIRFIRENKTPILPNQDEETYFQRIKSLSHAKTFTITKVTPHYGDGIFGEVLTNNEKPKYAAPFAELEAVADFGNSNMIVHLDAPIILSNTN